MTRPGSQYLEALRDGRDVVLDGSRVDDVTRHPAFSAGARSVACLFDLAHEPSHRHALTFPSPRDGRPVNVAWLTPRTREDLAARRRAAQTWAAATYGLMGRSPDHVASFFAGFAGSPETFAAGGREFADNLMTFYERARDEDLYLTYAIIHPTVDRGAAPHEQVEPNLYASVLEERDGGIVVRGAQMLGTGSVLSDYIFVSCIQPLGPGSEDYAISFVVPCNAPGLKLYVRRPYANAVTSTFDYPLSSRFDETDSLIVFHDVFVPWESVFAYRNLEVTFNQFSRTAAYQLGNTQAQIRFATKMRFLAGLARRIADANGTAKDRSVLEGLGDLAAMVTIPESALLAAESAFEVDSDGVARPSAHFLNAAMAVQPELYDSVLYKIRDLCGGSIMQVPSSVRAFQDDETMADINRYIRWPNATAPERIKLLKLTWDLIGSEFASRHLQYEMFYAGSNSVVKSRLFRAYPWDDATSLVGHCLDGYGFDGDEGDPEHHGWPGSRPATAPA